MIPEDKMDKMKAGKYRLLTFLFISFFLAFSVNAQTVSDQEEYQNQEENQKKCVNWFTPDNPVIGLQFGSAFPLAKDLRNPYPSADVIFTADFKELYLDAGIKFEFNQYDFSSHVYYMPTFNNSFQLGAGVGYHVYRYHDYFTEHDLSSLLCFRWIKGPVFSLEHNLGFLFKYTAIDAIQRYFPVVFNLTYQFELTGKWKFAPQSDFWCGVKLQDFFDYPLAISPFWKMGVDFALTPDFILGTDLTLKYIDMFFSAVYLNECVLRFTFKVVL